MVVYYHIMVQYNVLYCILYYGVCEENTLPEKKTFGTIILKHTHTHKIGGWGGVSPAVSQGKGSRKRSVFVTQTPAVTLRAAAEVHTLTCMFGLPC